MPAFIVAVVVAIGVAIGGWAVLGSMQKDAQVAYHSSTGVRL